MHASKAERTVLKKHAWKEKQQEMQNHPRSQDPGFHQQKSAYVMQFEFPTQDTFFYSYFYLRENKMSIM